MKTINVAGVRQRQRTYRRYSGARLNLPQVAFSRRGDVLQGRKCRNGQRLSPGLRLRLWLRLRLHFIFRFSFSFSPSPLALVSASAPASKDTGTNRNPDPHSPTYSYLYTIPFPYDHKYLGSFHPNLYGCAHQHGCPHKYIRTNGHRNSDHHFMQLFA